MRVAARPGHDVVLGGEALGAEVERREGHLGVVDLDDVDAVQVVDRGLVRRGGAQRVEGMWHVHQGALLLDARERLVEAQLGGMYSLRKRPMTSPSRDLISSATMTNGSPSASSRARKAPFDLVVVGDRDGAQPDLPGRPDDRLHGVLGVLGEVRVHVQVGVDPVRPGGAQQRPRAPSRRGDSSPMPRTWRESQWPPESCLPPGRRSRWRWSPGTDSSSRSATAAMEYGDRHCPRRAQASARSVRPVPVAGLSAVWTAVGRARREVVGREDGAEGCRPVSPALPEPAPADPR